MKAHTESIGRQKERKMLLKMLENREPEMVSVIGRRWIGKTFLIRSVYEQHPDSELTGIQNATQQRQLNHFSAQMQIAFGVKLEAKPKNWIDAFLLLITALETKNKQEKMVVFLDELSWLSTPKSGFLSIACTFSIKQNEYVFDLMDNDIRLDALFEP